MMNLSSFPMMVIAIALALGIAKPAAEAARGMFDQSNSAIAAANVGSDR